MKFGYTVFFDPSSGDHPNWAVTDLRNYPVGWFSNEEDAQEYCDWKNEK